MTRKLPLLMTAAGWIALAAMSTAAQVAAPATAPRTLTFEDQEAVKSPEGLAISRDGKLAAYALDDQVFVVPTAGGAPRA
ncbi:MAG: hypothetical protein ACRETY_05295, partial [Steroidobacteraceae bacterium]